MDCGESAMMICNAVISDCGLYRYKLSRHWEQGLQRLVFIGLNPSTADAIEDDPTVRKKIINAAMESPDFKKRIIKELVNEIGD